MQQTEEKGENRIKTTGGGFSLGKEGVTPYPGWERGEED